MAYRDPNPVDPRIPIERGVRQELVVLVQDYVAAHSLRAPLSFEELAEHAERLLASSSLDAAWRDYLTVLIHNEVWRPVVAGVPMDKRLLLLPPCFRNSTQCPADMDELGLQCRRCGRCVTGELVATAEKLGYLVLVAEGTAVVMSLIEAGRVEAIIGVSCTDALEKVFPHVAAAAIPSVAIPLVRRGCEQTTTDLDWLYEALTLDGPDRGQRINMDGLRSDVSAWFDRAALEELLVCADADGHAHGLSLDWLARSGKRWRPFLAACAHQALQDDPMSPIPADFRRIAVAVECFHKASLIHDDIEDADEFRYGLPSLHAEHGVPIALNVGDMLLGMGYRLLAACGASGEAKAAMLQAAGDGHCQLCAGQGAELAWVADPQPLSVPAVLEIFLRKTAPAFDVALRLGAIYAGADDTTLRVLNQFSRALGVAYQISDDLDDFSGDESRGTGVPPVSGMGFQPMRLEGFQPSQPLDNSQDLPPGTSTATGGTPVGRMGETPMPRSDAGETPAPRETSVPCGDGAAMRPNILLAIAHERAQGADRSLLEALWRRQASMAEHGSTVSDIFRTHHVEEHARELMEQYKGQAMASLAGLVGPRGDVMRMLLARVTARIFYYDHSRGNVAAAGEGSSTV